MNVGSSQSSSWDGLCRAVLISPTLIVCPHARRTVAVSSLVSKWSARTHASRPLSCTHSLETGDVTDERLEAGVDSNDERRQGRARIKGQSESPNSGGRARFLFWSVKASLVGWT